VGIPPALYVAVACFFLAYISVANPSYAGLGLGLTLLGVPAYFFWRRSGA
jgi:uncharacterized membrane protein YccC